MLASVYCQHRRNCGLIVARLRPAGGGVGLAHKHFMCYVCPHLMTSTGLQQETRKAAAVMPELCSPAWGRQTEASSSDARAHLPEANSE